MGNWKIILVIGASILSLALAATGESNAAPGVVKGWLKAGPDMHGYSIGTEESDRGVVAYIQSEDPKPLEYAVLMQRFTSENYQGKRLRLSAMVKAINVNLFSGMWLRVDLGEKIVAFDNMMNRPISGTTDWRACTIVLDVPVESDVIMMGLALQGEGKVLWTNLKLEEVGSDVPVTEFYNLGIYEKNDKPANLDFEQ